MFCNNDLVDYAANVFPTYFMSANVFEHFWIRV